MHQELTLAIQGNRAAGRVQGHLLPWSQPPAFVYNHVNRQAWSQHGMD